MEDRGAPAWITGVYDPATNQLFWPTGNPSPSNRGEGRAGDNLYSNTLLALNADTGKLNWHFQFTKHDEHDWDATQIPIMIDAGSKHLIAQGQSQWIFLRCGTGRTASCSPRTRMPRQLGAAARMLRVGQLRTKKSSPTPEGRTVCPGAIGSTNWMSPTFDSQTGLFYVTAREECDIFSTAPPALRSRTRLLRQRLFPVDKAEPYWGALRALDPPMDNESGSSATFHPLTQACFRPREDCCLPARPKKFPSRLMRLPQTSVHFQMGGAVYASADGLRRRWEEYVAIAAGSSLYTFGLP